MFYKLVNSKKKELIFIKTYTKKFMNTFSYYDVTSNLLIIIIVQNKPILHLSYYSLKSLNYLFLTQNSKLQHRHLANICLLYATMLKNKRLISYFMVFNIAIMLTTKLELIKYFVVSTYPWLIKNLM